jgi:hypothetical protein
MANNAANVSTGKPQASGAVYVAPAGTAVPTDAASPLSSEWKGLGYISEDGVKNAVETDSEKIVAWGGDTVLEPQTSYSETYQAVFIETSEEVLKEYWGENNVISDPSGITVVHTASELSEHPWVIEMLLKGNRVKRTVIPSGKVTTRGEIAYVDGEPIGYDMTISTFPDPSGATAYDYIAQIATP